jgi:hypothetical protein
MKIYCAIDDDHEVPGALFAASSEEKFKELEKEWKILFPKMKIEMDIHELDVIE